MFTSDDGDRGWAGAIVIRLSLGLSTCHITLSSCTGVPAVHFTLFCFSPYEVRVVYGRSLLYMTMTTIYIIYFEVYNNTRI